MFFKWDGLQGLQGFEIKWVPSQKAYLKVHGEFLYKITHKNIGRILMCILLLGNYYYVGKYNEWPELDLRHKIMFHIWGLNNNF